MATSPLHDILQFWFGSLKDPYEYPESQSKIWFEKNPSIDKEIQDTFESLIPQADGGIFDEAASTAKGRLALIILYDQFTRNIYRDTPKAFAWDSMALKLTKEGLEKGDDQKLYPIERTFFYMPLMHSENLQDQNLCIALFEKLSETSEGKLKSSFANNLNYAIAHRDIIQRFSRFPHRNEILRRLSTHEEMLFLKKPGSSF